jgi:hypothetical protein
VTFETYHSHRPFTIAWTIVSQLNTDNSTCGKPGQTSAGGILEIIIARFRGKGGLVGAMAPTKI